jgi:hypothetical protein
MKFLKTYELYTGNNIDYTIGDTVVCSKDHIAQMKPTKYNPLKEGDKYKVLKIYSPPEDKFLKNPFLRVDVENLETGEVSRGWESNRFKLEFEFDAGKYNI